MTQTQKIILVDDDPIMRELALSNLLEAGYDVATAQNGAEALALVKDEGADLVISDLDMPVMSGFELTENIRADKTVSEIPVIVITASDHPDAVDRAFAAGATSFLAKPINWSLFNHAVRFIMRASDDRKALRVARDQAEAGARFKDSLMSVMSHELRTPLNAIIGFGQLLGETFEQQNDDLHREYADYIVDGGKRLLNSVSDMLLASDARTGPIRISETDLTVADLVEAARSQEQKQLETAGANVTIRLQTPELEICVDRALMAKAIGKLIDNSVKFSPRGVNIVVAAASSKTGDLAFMVKDDGPGIAPETLVNVATPFSQSDMSIRRSKEGLGLGLPLVKAIADAHGASFKIDSTPGAGTRVVIVLPASRVNSAPATQVA